MAVQHQLNSLVLTFACVASTALFGLRSGLLLIHLGFLSGTQHKRVTCPWNLQHLRPRWPSFEPVKVIQKLKLHDFTLRALILPQNRNRLQIVCLANPDYGNSVRASLITLTQPNATEQQSSVEQVDLSSRIPLSDPGVWFTVLYSQLPAADLGLADLSTNA